MSEMHFTDIDAQVIYDSVIDSLEAGVSERLYEGDERLIFGEALVAILVGLYNTMDDVAKQKTLRYARGEVLDALGERLGTERLEPAKATTILRFYAEENFSKEIFIPAGTKVSDQDGIYYFQTKHSAILKKIDSDTTLFIDVEAESLEGGSDYNGFLEGEINKLIDLIPFINVGKVKNITTTAGGNNGEPYNSVGDDNYRERIRIAPAAISAAGTAEAYRYHALKADPDLCDVKVVNVKDEDGNIEAGKIIIYPLLESREISDSNYEEIIKKIEDIITDSKIRALTDEIEVSKPEKIEYEIELNCYIDPEDRSAVETTVEGPGGAVERYIKWQKGAIGRALNPDELIKMILSPDWEEGLTGARRVKILNPSVFTFYRLLESEVAVTTKDLVKIHYKNFDENEE